MAIIFWLIRRILSLRYDVRVHGLDKIDARAASGRLFLPNHPALIDPVILMAWLWPRCRPRPLADARQISRPVIGWFARWMGVIRIPDPAQDGAAAGAAIREAMRECVQAMESGQSVLFYPSGRLMASRFENLEAASGAAELLARCPEATPVAIRTIGLWGSAFGRGAAADGRYPQIGRVLWRGAWLLLASGIFFMPRRRVDIELALAWDLPRRGGKAAVNAWLERFYNQDAPPRMYVPHAWWKRRGGVQALPDPVLPPSPDLKPTDAESIDPDIRASVYAKIAEMAGTAPVDNPSLRLAGDLGLDSLSVGALAVWISERYGVPLAPPSRLATQGDLAAAAAGKLPPETESPTRDSGKPRPPPPKAWFRPSIGSPDDAALTVEGATLPLALLDKLARDGRRLVVADGASFRSTRGMMTVIQVLAPYIASLPAGPEGRVGIMLPAGAAAISAFWATLWAGRVPVMVNWTVGANTMSAGLDGLDVRSVVTALPLVGRLEAGGLDFGAARERFAYLDQFAAGLAGKAKMAAAWRAWRRRPPLREPTPDDTAVILFTSGSESMPKAVPLTHANLASNLADALSALQLKRSDATLAMLPPFHSFGLLVGVVAPLISGLRVACHPSPLEGEALAGLCGRLRLSVLVGTPTFMAYIARKAGGGELRHARMVITGAEGLGESARGEIAGAAANAALVEGYGITECSPILAVDDPAHPIRGSVGKPLSSLSWAMVDPDNASLRVDGAAAPGRLLVRGPTVFGGYLPYGGQTPPDPFVQLDGEWWYDTGDLLRVDDQGRWHFAGRRKRFIKLGGEMISLPAIEAALEAKWPPAVPPGAAPGAPPSPAVVVIGRHERGKPGAPAVSPAAKSASAEEPTELWGVAVAGRGVQLEEANQVIRLAGLSGLHRLRGIVEVPAIPLLGTGKVDYRSLAAL